MACNPQIVAMADERARARWEWVQEGVPVVDLPAAALQESHLLDPKPSPIPSPNLNLPHWPQF